MAGQHAQCADFVKRETYWAARPAPPMKQRVKASAKAKVASKKKPTKKRKDVPARLKRKYIKSGKYKKAQGKSEDSGLPGKITTEKPKRILITKEVCLHPLCVSAKYLSLHEIMGSVRFVSRMWNANGVRFGMTKITFVLDRFHESNHTTCTNPESKFYDPDITLAAHPEFKSFCSTAAEVTFAQLKKHAPVTRMLSFNRSKLFLAVVVYARNKMREEKGNASRT